ncbi:hypothetical protein, partial [Streptomyces sp. P17]|uniref:hypothetical protein n=1 Tax=Streptomyces sp. P17 TaxID=3074716 RepID=UPI0028F44D84
PGRPVELHIGVRAAQSTPIIRSGASIFARIQTNNSSSLATMSPGGIEALLQAHAVTGFFSLGEQFTPRRGADPQRE